MSKPKFRRRAADRSVAARAVMEHPRWTLSTLASLAAIIPAGIYIIGWAGGFVETPWKAKEREERIRLEWQTKVDELKTDLKKDVALLYGEEGKLRGQVENRWAADSRQQAGILLQIMENKVTVAVGRVNACNVMRQNKKMTTLEKNVCDDYDRDYAEAKRRFENQQNAATQTWTTRP